MHPRSYLRALLAVSMAVVPITSLSARQIPTEARERAADAVRFDIAAGPLQDALGAYERITGHRIQTTSSLANLVSPGVTGVHTPEAALTRLLSGTGLGWRQAGGGVFVLEPGAAVRRIEITGDLPRYAADRSPTATKTATPLLDVPQTLTVVPRALLVEQQAQSVADAVRNVPAASVAQGEGNRDQIVLRGFSSASDFFVNGIRDDQERFRDLYNVQSIEVLQGPAAVLFGRGGAGGVVNLVTAQPDASAPSEATVELGAYGHKRATTQIGGSAGRAALRLSAMGERSSGFRDGFFLERHAVNPVVRVTLDAKTDLTASYEHLRDHRLADRGIPSRSGRPVGTPIEQLFGSRDQNDAQSGVDSAGVTLNRRLTSSVRLRSAFLAGRYDKFYRNVYPGSAVSAANTLTLAAYDHGIDRTNIFNETDLISDRATGRIAHRLLAGVEWGYQSQDEIRHTAASVAQVPLSGSVRDAAFDIAPLVVDRRATAHVLAAYAQDQMTLARHWKAVAGVRVDRFSVAVEDHLPGSVNLSRTDVAASPRAGLIYQPASNLSLYANYSYTFLPSGQTLGLAANTVELKPEHAKNYEVGAKAEVLQRRVTVAASLFRLDRNHMKSVDPNNPARLVLTGQQRTDGFTLSAAGRVAPRLELYGGYAELDASITRATTAAPAGNRPGLVPRRQGSLWIACDATTRVRLGAGVVSQTSIFTSFTNAVALPGYTRLDGSVSYRIKALTLSVNAANLTNVRYYPTANGDNNISPGAPRFVQLAIRTTF